MCFARSLDFSIHKTIEKKSPTCEIFTGLGSERRASKGACQES